MAKKDSISLTITPYDYLTFMWEETSQSIEKNTTTISWKMILVSTSAGAIYSSVNKAWSVTVNGTKYSGTNSVAIGNNAEKTLASGTTTIQHNTDGTKTFSYSFSQEFNITFSGASIKTKSGSGTGTLTTIARAAYITNTLPLYDNETKIAIGYKNAAGSAVSKLEACIAIYDEPSGYWTASAVPYREISKTATSYTFNLTSAELTALRKAVETPNGKLTIRYYIKTTIGSTTLYDYTENNFILTDFIPIITPTIKDIGGNSTRLTGNPNKIIKGFNVIEYSIGATARKEAYITSQRITCGSQSSTTATGTLVNVDSGTFNLSATDNRTSIVYKNANLDLIEYIPLTCNLEASIELSGENTSKIKFNGSGNYWAGNFGAVNNTLSVWLTIGASDGSWGTSIPIDTSINSTKNTYSFTGEYEGLDYTKTYIVRATAGDEVVAEGFVSNEITLKTIPVYDWSENDFNFNVPVSIHNVEQPYLIERGTSGIWTYEKWSNGIAKCWGTFTHTTAITTAWGSLYVGNDMVGRINYPIVFASKPVEQVTLHCSSSAAFLMAESGGNGVNGAYATAIYNVCRPNAVSNSQTFYLNYYIVGKWR